MESFLKSFILHLKFKNGKKEKKIKFLASDIENPQDIFPISVRTFRTESILQFRERKEYGLMNKGMLRADQGFPYM